MNSLELLTEAVTGDITVGFELECIVPTEDNDSSQMKGSIIGAISDAGYGVTDDSSIEPDYEDSEIGVEIDIGTVAGKFGQQRRISASPSDFASVSKFIAFLFTNGAYVNDSCGFHAHFGLGELRSADSLRNLWFACYFVKEGLFNRYSHYTTDPEELEYNKTIPTFRVNDEGKRDATYSERAGIEQFEDTEYASFLSLEESVTEFENYLNEITSKKAKIEYAAQVGMNKLGTAGFEKYNLMNIHEQGTVEWRGLRFGNMYNHGDATLRIVGEYLKFVYKFARELAKAYTILPKYEIGGITLMDIQRYFHQGKVKRNTTSKHLADAFRETFSALNVPKNVVQKSLQQFLKQVGTRGATATELFQDPATAEKLVRSMSTFATLATPIFSGADYTGVSLLDPNIQVDKLRFLLELKDVGFHSATFDFKPKLWQKLLVQHGFNFVDCTFQQCSFNWEDPHNYAEFNPYYGFDQCTFIDCVFTFPTNEIKDRIETAGQQKNRGTAYGQWQRFMIDEDIESKSRETSVPVQEPETETTEESLVQQYKKDIQYLTEFPNVKEIQQRRNVDTLRRAGFPEFIITKDGHVVDISGKRLQTKEIQTLVSELKAKGTLGPVAAWGLLQSNAVRKTYAGVLNSQILQGGAKEASKDVINSQYTALRKIVGASHNDYRSAIEPVVEKSRKVINLLAYKQGKSLGLLAKHVPKGFQTAKILPFTRLAGAGGLVAGSTGVGIPVALLGILIFLVGEMLTPGTAGEGSDVVPKSGLEDAEATINLATQLALDGNFEGAQLLFPINPPWNADNAEEQGRIAIEGVRTAIRSAEADEELQQTIKAEEERIAKINPDIYPPEEDEPEPEPITPIRQDPEPGEEGEEEFVGDEPPEWITTDPEKVEPLKKPEEKPIGPGDPEWKWPPYEPHILPPDKKKTPTWDPDDDEEIWDPLPKEPPPEEDEPGEDEPEIKPPDEEPNIWDDPEELPKDPEKEKEDDPKPEEEPVPDPKPEEEPEPEPVPEPVPEPKPEVVPGPVRTRPQIPGPIWPYIDPWEDPTTDPIEDPVPWAPVPEPEIEPGWDPEPKTPEEPRIAQQPNYELLPNIDPIIKPQPITQIKPELVPHGHQGPITTPTPIDPIVVPPPIIGPVVKPAIIGPADDPVPDDPDPVFKPITKQEIEPDVPVYRSTLSKDPTAMVKAMARARKRKGKRLA